MSSLDPRVNRLDLQRISEGEQQTNTHLITYEVFHQEKKGDHHSHVGSLHAPNPEMAFLMAKEQYARRGRCVNIWVVKTSDIFTTN